MLLLKLLNSALDFASARDTIFSASKKKNFAISLGKIKSLIKTSKPTSLVNSFSSPSINICSVSCLVFKL